MHDYNDQQPESVKVKLSDGTIILMDLGGQDGYADRAISAQGLLIAGQKTFSAVKSLAKDLKAAIVEAKPSKATVEFSMELEKKGNDVFSKICNVSGKGSIKVTLEWNFGNEVTKE